MSETDLQVGGGYVYQWECALLLALNHFFEPVRYDPTLFDLIRGFLGQVAEMQLEGEDRHNGIELEDINLINGDRRILIQVKTKQAEGERWTPTDSLLLKALYRFYESRAFAEGPDKGRFVFLTNRPFSPDLVRVKSAIKKGTVSQCAEVGKLYQQLVRYAKTEKKAGVDRDRFDAVLGRTALVEYLSVDAVKANVQAKLQAYGRADWKEAHALLLEYFMRQSTRVGGGRVTRESVAEVLGPARAPVAAVSPLHQLPADLADSTGREKEMGELVAPMRPPRQLKVFLCHASGDKPAVRDLYRRLRADGIAPWLDEEDLLPGQDWELEIPKAVRSSDAAIICLSSRAITKAGYVQKEIKDALDVADKQPEGTIFLIPLRLEECDVPERLRRWQWVDFYQKTGYERLIRALRTRAGDLGLALHPSEPEIVHKPISSLEESKRGLVEGQELKTDLLERLKRLLAEDPSLAAQLSTLIGSTVITGEGNVVVYHDVVTVNKLSGGDYTIHTQQLPADLPDFTGREEEVHELVALLSGGGGGAKISAIGGMGGVGKTALAVHVAHQVAAQYPDGQIVVEMGGTSERAVTPVEAMGQVVRAFQPEMRLPEDPNEVAAFYRTTLEGRKALLLLDNAANSAQVWPLVPPAECGLVVTSRHSISLPGLRHFDLDALPEKQARKLLRTIVGRRRATGEELDAIAGLCGRLPLALRVAGDFLVVHPDWSAGEYAQALADERERLVRLKHEDLDVGAALGLSAAQLVREQPELAARWQMLSVFPAPFEQAAAAAVWGVEEGEARDGLSELAARSLALYEREGGLYRLPGLMRLVAEDAFGYGGGKREGERERERLGEAVTRHAAYYLEMGRRADALYLQGGEQVVEGLRQFDGAWPHLRAAYGRMRGREDEVALQWTSAFPDRVAYVLDLRLAPRDKIPILEAAVSAARALSDRRGEGAHLGALGRAYADLGEVRRAIKHCEQAVTIAREVGDRRMEGNDLGNLGVAYAALGDVRRAIEHYEQALAIHRALGDWRGEGVRLGNLGNAYFVLGEVRRAIEYYEQALEIAREIGDRGGEGADLGSLGNAYYSLGEVWRAIEHYEQALAIDREIGDRRMGGIHLGNLGVAYKNVGDLVRARELWEQALRVFEDIEDPNAERVRGWLKQLNEG